MEERRSIECGPIQNSNVLVMGSSPCGHNPPLTPPTSSESPPASVYESIVTLDLDEKKIFDDASLKDRRMLDGIHVLATQAQALQSLAMLYETHPTAQDGFSRSVEAIVRQRHHRAKLVISGVGKSGYIGRKLVATFQSLGVPAVFMHPTEALHGDLGLLQPHDTFMFITFSGKTAELLLLLPHLPESMQLIVLTSHTEREACALLNDRPDGILLPAPVHMTEVESFGVAAPTTSTTTALALGDALAIAVAKEIHVDMPAIFARNHPGGSIGAAMKLSRQDSV